MEYPAALSRPGSGRGCPAGANGVFSKSDDAARLPAALEEIYTEGYYSSAYVSKDLIKAARRNSIASVNITDREAEFLKLCATELTYVQIADKLGIGKRTVDGYRENLFQKLHISSRTGLAMFAIQSGLVVI